MPRILVLAPPGDPIAAHVTQVARARDVEVASFDFHGGVPIAWDGEAWIAGGQDLASFQGIFVRRMPARGALLDPDPRASQAAIEWWRQGIAQSERAEVAEACLLDLAARGIRVVNPPSLLDQKSAQLTAFARAGLPIPRTMITNFAPAARAFAADVGIPVAKPVLGGAEARLLEDLSDTALAGLAAAPVILQSRALGPDVRVTVVAGRVVSAVEIPSSTLDYRSGAEYRAGTLAYVPHALSGAGHEIAVRAAALCGHVLSGVDLKAGASGTYTLIEANTSPVYLDIELKTGAGISAAIVDHLAGA